uniref:(northern house mosquito) hypothetical protein n=1 Tax=Culex pipiens TaxID=7175 RepID=A0A8D8HYA4_CULPI
MYCKHFMLGELLLLLFRNFRSRLSSGPRLSSTTTVAVSTGGILLLCASAGPSMSSGWCLARSAIRVAHWLRQFPPPCHDEAESIAAIGDGDDDGEIGGGRLSLHRVACW